LKLHPGFFVFISLCAGVLAAQDGAARHSLEVGGGRASPLGYTGAEYSAGPALYAGYELRLQKHVAVEAGWTGSWLPGTWCSSQFGCERLREETSFLDYGLRGIVPVAAGRVELSVGLGGGYIWYRPPEGYYYTSSPNGSLLQYSGRATVAIDHHKHFRVGFTIRTWRDLGRPTQQWLSTAVGLIYGLGEVR
jgi:hypothetical protein